MTKSLTQQILDRAGTTAKRGLRRVVGGSDDARAAEPLLNGRHARPETTARRVAGPRLSPSDALRENGFTVFRGLFPAPECAELAQLLKHEAGIRDGVKFTKVDSTNSYPTTREILLEGRILGAVRAALGPDAKFLQVSDLHYLHDTAGWHRDSVHRAPDASDAPDWRDVDHPFGVVKAILYLESDNAAMGIMAGSHASPIAMDGPRVKAIEAAGGQIVIDAAEQPNQRFTTAEKKLPLAWRAEVGDVLVFDERMYHAGRRVDAGQRDRQSRGTQVHPVAGVRGGQSPFGADVFLLPVRAAKNCPIATCPPSFVESSTTADSSSRRVGRTSTAASPRNCATSTCPTRAG